MGEESPDVTCGQCGLKYSGQVTETLSQVRGLPMAIQEDLKGRKISSTTMADTPIAFK